MNFGRCFDLQRGVADAETVLQVAAGLGQECIAGISPAGMTRCAISAVSVVLIDPMWMSWIDPTGRQQVTKDLWEY